MKFTEGYWVRSERANGLYAGCTYDIQEIPGGLRVLAPCGNVKSRAETLNMPAIVVEFTSSGNNCIGVRSYHYEGYDSKEARFDLTIKPQAVKVDINDKEAVMSAGDVAVRINRDTWGYQFEAAGRVITSCGFRNLGYMRYNKKVSTMLPEDNYLSSEYDPYMVTELSLQPGECVYGLGERFTAFVKNGQVIDTWNEDGGTSSQVTYKAIPLYITNKGYGIFVDHTDNVSFEVASEKVEYVGFSVPGEELRYHFIYGPTPKEIIRFYTDLTGKPALPPAWSFGLWLTTSFTTNYDEKTTSFFINGMKERDIPLSVFHFDTFWMKEFHWCDFEWDERIFPDVREMILRYKEQGLKINVWINPYIAQGTDFFREGANNGYLLKRADGKGIWQTDYWQTGMGIVDFTNPAAVNWYTDKLKTLLDMGVDAFKSDFGERIPIDVEYHDGADPKSMHNYYAYLYAKAVFDLLEREKGKNKAILFARSATAGSQKYPIHWGGDCSANYPSMAETLRGGLSLSMSGFSFWSHDISGFEQTASPDLYKRWVQFGMLSSHSRLHGSTSYRVPWVFDEEAVDVLRYFTKLKCRMMPYIYSLSVLAHQEGIPLMRPMILEFPLDPAVNYLDMQYMLGNSLLIAPIFNEYGAVDYYLPEGKWTHFLSDEPREGGKWYHDTYDYFSLPLYVRENTILPIGRTEDRPDYDYLDQLTLHFYALKDMATCKVAGVEGEYGLVVTAEKKDNKVVVTTSRKVEGLSVVLHNMKDMTIEII